MDSMEEMDTLTPWLSSSSRFSAMIGSSAVMNGRMTSTFSFSQMSMTVGI